MARPQTRRDVLLAFLLFALQTLAFLTDVPSHLSGMNERADVLFKRDPTEVLDVLLLDPSAYVVPNATKIQARVATTFDQAVSTGCSRLNWMQGLAPGPATQFTQYAQLAANGWMENISQTSGLPADLVNAYTALGYSTAMADNAFIFTYQVPSSGTYALNYNVKNGAIVAQFTESPQNADPSAAPPALSALSDVAWLTYAEQAQLQGVNIEKSINTIFRYHIATPFTLSVINQVLTNLGQGTPGDWPGVSVTEQPELQNLQALIGTTHGSLPTYLLGQHKTALQGNGYVSSVNIFKTSGDFNLAYRISYE